MHAKQLAPSWRPERDEPAPECAPGCAKALPFWRDDKHVVCQQISARKGRIKFVLKTKDERSFIKEWVGYYSKIVPIQDIIIFDNMSQDPVVLDYYNEIASEALVIRYDGFHNYLHVVEMFPELYEALAASCEYFCILDSDEFLVLIDNEQFASTAAIADFIIGRGHDALPSTWLANSMKSRTIFKCGASPRLLEAGMTWGKPVVKSSADLRGIILHNIQLDKSFYNADTPSNLFLMHLTELYPEQRIRVNIAKLIARKFAAPDDALESILTRSTDGIEDSNVHLYLSEIKRLISSSKEATNGLYQGTIEIVPESNVGHFSSVEREAMRLFLTRGAGKILEMNAQ